MIVQTGYLLELDSEFHDLAKLSSGIKKLLDHLTGFGFSRDLHVMF